MPIFNKCIINRNRMRMQIRPTEMCIIIDRTEWFMFSNSYWGRSPR